MADKRPHTLAIDIHTQSRDQFLTIDETASLLDIEAADLRHGIACGLVPIRRDNQGALRIHRAEVPEDLLVQIARSEVDPRLHVESLVDEISMLREQLNADDKVRSRLEQLLEQQAAALARSTAVLDQNESDIAKLSALLESSMQMLDRFNHSTDTAVAKKVATNKKTVQMNTAVKLDDSNAELQKIQQENARLHELLKRAMTAIEASGNLPATDEVQLIPTTDKAMQLVERAVNDAERAKSDVGRMSALMDRALSTTARIESEIDQRNSVIDKQHELMNRLVSISEQSLIAPDVKAKRKRSFWQRLWGAGKGI